MTKEKMGFGEKEEMGFVEKEEMGFMEKEEVIAGNKKEAMQGVSFNEKIKKVMWNISDVKKVLETWDFLKNYDIIIILETWLEKNKERQVLNSLSKGYTWKAKAATRKNKRGRAMGGVIVGVRKNMGKTLIIEDWEYGLVIQDLRQINGDKLNYITVYNNVKITECLGKLNNLLEKESMKEIDVILTGDLNARIGECNENEDVISRYSKDKMCNSAGVKLLDFCNKNALIKML